MRKLLCKLGIHKWFTSPGGNRRGCVVCLIRQVRQIHGWGDHTYPLDANPAKDPTPCVDEYGDESTLGFEYIWAKSRQRYER